LRIASGVSVLGDRVGIGTIPAVTIPACVLDVAGAINIGTHVTGVAPQLQSADAFAGFSILQVYPSAGVATVQTFNIIPRGIPGGGVRAQFSVLNTDFIADSVNYEVMSFRATGAYFELLSTKSGGGTARPLRISASSTGSGTNQLYLKVDGGVGIATALPTANLHIAGSAAGAANTASLKIDAGVLLGATEAGAIESNGTHLYWTDAGGVRHQLD